MSWRVSVSQRVISTVEITCPGDRLCHNSWSVLLRSHVLEIVCVTTSDQYCWDHMSWRSSV